MDKRKLTDDCEKAWKCAHALRTQVTMQEKKLIQSKIAAQFPSLRHTNGDSEQDAAQPTVPGAYESASINTCGSNDAGSNTLPSTGDHQVIVTDLKQRLHSLLERSERLKTTSKPVVANGVQHSTAANPAGSFIHGQQLHSYLKPPVSISHSRADRQSASRSAHSSNVDVTRPREQPGRKIDEPAVKIPRQIPHSRIERIREAVNKAEEKAQKQNVRNRSSLSSQHSTTDASTGVSSTANAESKTKDASLSNHQSTPEPAKTCIVKGSSSEKHQSALRRQRRLVSPSHFKLQRQKEKAKAASEELELQTKQAFRQAEIDRRRAEARAFRQEQLKRRHLQKVAAANALPEKCHQTNRTYNLEETHRFMESKRKAAQFSALQATRQQIANEAENQRRLAAVKKEQEERAKKPLVPLFLEQKFVPRRRHDDTAASLLLSADLDVERIRQKIRKEIHQPQPEPQEQLNAAQSKPVQPTLSLLRQPSERSSSSGFGFRKMPREADIPASVTTRAGSQFSSVAEPTVPVASDKFVTYGRPSLIDENRDPLLDISADSEDSYNIVNTVLRKYPHLKSLNSEELLDLIFGGADKSNLEMARQLHELDPHADQPAKSSESTAGVLSYAAADARQPASSSERSSSSSSSFSLSTYSHRSQQNKDISSGPSHARYQNAAERERNKPAARLPAISAEPQPQMHLVDHHEAISSAGSGGSNRSDVRSFSPALVNAQRRHGPPDVVPLTDANERPNSSSISSVGSVPSLPTDDGNGAHVVPAALRTKAMVELNHLLFLDQTMREIDELSHLNAAGAAATQGNAVASNQLQQSSSFAHGSELLQKPCDDAAASVPFSVAAIEQLTETQRQLLIVIEETRRTLRQSASDHNLAEGHLTTVAAAAASGAAAAVLSALQSQSLTAFQTPPRKPTNVDDSSSTTKSSSAASSLRSAKRQSTVYPSSIPAAKHGVSNSSSNHRTSDTVESSTNSRGRRSTGQSASSIATDLPAASIGSEAAQLQATISSVTSAPLSASVNAASDVVSDQQVVTAATSQSADVVSSAMDEVSDQPESSEAHQSVHSVASLPVATPKRQAGEDSSASGSSSVDTDSAGPSWKSETAEFGSELAVSAKKLLSNSGHTHDFHERLLKQHGHWLKEFITLQLALLHLQKRQNQQPGSTSTANAILAKMVDTVESVYSLRSRPLSHEDVAEHEFYIAKYQLLSQLTKRQLASTSLSGMNPGTSRLSTELPHDMLQFMHPSEALLMSELSHHGTLDQFVSNRTQQLDERRRHVARMSEYAETLKRLRVEEEEVRRAERGALRQLVESVASPLTPAAANAKKSERKSTPTKRPKVSEVPNAAESPSQDTRLQSPFVDLVGSPKVSIARPNQNSASASVATAIDESFNGVLPTTPSIPTEEGIDVNSGSKSTLQSITEAQSATSEINERSVATAASIQTDASATNDVTSASSSAPSTARSVSSSVAYEEQRSSGSSSTLKRSAAASQQSTARSSRLSLAGHELVREVAKKRRDDVFSRTRRLSIDSSVSLSVTSEFSEHEARLRVLRDELKERRTFAEKLKQDYKMKNRERLEETERSLKRQIEAYDRFISQTSKQIEVLEAEPPPSSSHRASTPPRMLSPRAVSSDARLSLGGAETVASTGQQPVLTPRRSQSPRTAAAAFAAISGLLDTKELAELGVKPPRASLDNSQKSAQQRIAPAAERRSSWEKRRRSFEAEKTSSEETEENASSSEVIAATQSEERHRTSIDENLTKSAGTTSSSNASPAASQDDSASHSSTSRRVDSAKVNESSLRAEQADSDDVADEVDEVLVVLSEEAVTAKPFMDATLASDRSLANVSGSAELNLSPRPVVAVSETINAPTLPDMNRSLFNASTDDIMNEQFQSPESLLNSTEGSARLSARNANANDLSSLSDSLSRAIESAAKSVAEFGPLDDQQSPHSLSLVDKVLQKELTACLEFMKRDEGVSESASVTLPLTSVAEPVALSVLIPNESHQATIDKVANNIFDSLLIDSINSVLKRPKETNKSPPVSPRNIAAHSSDAVVIRESDLRHVLEIAEEALQSRRDSFPTDQTQSDVDHLSTGNVTPTSSPRFPISPRSPADRFMAVYKEPHRNAGQISPRSPTSPKKAKLADLSKCLDFEADSKNDMSFEGAEAFGADDEWFDDDLRPQTSSVKDAHLSSETAITLDDVARTIDLDNVAHESFSVVPCKVEEINAVVDCAVAALFDQRVRGELIADVAMPRDLLAAAGVEADSVFRDCSSAFAEFLFDLCRDVTSAIYANEQEQIKLQRREATNQGKSSGAREGLISSISAPPWIKAPRLRLCPFAKVPPKTLDALKLIVRDQVQIAIGLAESREEQSVFAKINKRSFISKRKLDTVDKILLAELYADESNWRNFDDEELLVKFQMADAICDSLLKECLPILAPSTI